MHTTDTKNRIIEFIRTHGKATNKQLRELTGITQVGISKHLKDLVDSSKIYKFGQHPRHTYQLTAQEGHKIMAEINKKTGVEEAFKGLQDKVRAVNESQEMQGQLAQVNAALKSKILKEITSQAKADKDIPEKVLKDIARKLTNDKKPTAKGTVE